MSPTIGNNVNQANFSFSPKDDESPITTNHENKFYKLYIIYRPKNNNNKQKTSDGITYIPAGTEVIPAYKTTKIIIDENGAKETITRITDAVQLMFDLEI